jgi:hypothetical protein
MNRIELSPAISLIIRVIAMMVITILAAYAWFFADAEPTLKAGSLPASVAIISFGVAAFCASVELKTRSKHRASSFFLYLTTVAILFSPILNKYPGIDYNISMYLLFTLFIFSLIIFGLAAKDD